MKVKQLISKSLIILLVVLLTTTSVEFSAFASEHLQEVQTEQQNNAQDLNNNKEEAVVFQSYMGPVSMYSSDDASSALFYVNFIGANDAGENVTLASLVPHYTNSGVSYPLVDGDGVASPSLNPTGRQFSHWTLDGEIVDLNTLTVSYSEEELAADPFIVKEVTLVAVYKEEAVTSNKTITYVYEDGTEAHPSREVVIGNGETVNLDSPEINGAELVDSSQATLSITGSSANEIIVTYRVLDAVAVNYSVEHYFEDASGEYVLDETKTESLTGTAGNYTEGSAVVADGYTLQGPIEQKMLKDGVNTTVEIYYKRETFFITFNTGSGSQVDPISSKFGASITTPAAPTRSGYTFDGYTGSDGSTINADLSNFPTTMPQENVVYTAKWIGEEVEYTVVYWLEKPNVLPSEDLNDNSVELYNTDNYSYVKTEKTTGTSGVVANIDDINTTPFELAGEHYTSDYATYSWNDAGSKEVLGDGTTVVNVYYTRTLYALTFTSASTLELNLPGQDVQHLNSAGYTMYAKYEQDISDIWPSQKYISASSYGTTIISWTYISLEGNKTHITHRTEFTLDLIPSTGTTLKIKGNSGNVNYLMKYSAKYYAEVLSHELTDEDVIVVEHNGKQYVEIEKLTEDYYNYEGGMLGYKELEGLKIHDTVSSEDGYSKEFYYTRDRIDINFNLQLSASLPIDITSPDSILDVLYQEELKEYEPTELPVGTVNPETGYTFAGWYYEAECKNPVNWESDTMPNVAGSSITLFAKWIPPQYDVHFSADGGTLEHNVSGETLETVTLSIDENAMIGNSLEYTPTRLGYIFTGWIIDENKNGVRDAGEDTYFALEQQIKEEKYAVASWIESGEFTYEVIHQYDDGVEVKSFVQTFTGVKVGQIVEANSLSSSILISAGWPSGYYVPNALSTTSVITGENDKIIFTYTKTDTIEFNYTVKYVDQEGNEIRATENLTTTALFLTINAPYIEGYKLTSDVTLAAFLSSSDENVFTFTYSTEDTSATSTVTFYTPEGVKMENEVSLDTAIGNKILFSEIINNADVEAIIDAQADWDVTTSKYDYKIVANNTKFEIYFDYKTVLVDYFGYNGDLIYDNVEEKVTLAPSKTNEEGLPTGTTFKYWVDASGNIVNTITADTTKLYAVVEHNVVFKNGSTVLTDEIIEHNGDMPTVENPTNGVMKFIGWSLTEGATEADVVVPTTVTNAATYYAVFVEQQLELDTVDVDGENLTKVYDGEALTFSNAILETTVEESEITDVVYKYYGDLSLETEVTDLSQLNVGTKTLYVVATKEGYIDSAPLAVTLEVSPRVLEVTIDNASKKYGEEDSINYEGYTITDGEVVVGEEIAVAISRTGKGDNNGTADEVGNYLDSLVGTVTAGNASTNLNNYHITVFEGDFEITKGDLTVTGFNATGTNQSKEYDGNELQFNQSIITTTDASDTVVTTGLTYTYYEASIDGTKGKEISLADVNVTNVLDSKQFIVVISGDNFIDEEILFSMTITPRALEVTINDAQKPYGVEDVYNEYTITGGELVAGEDIEVTIYRNGIGAYNGKFDTVGEYTGTLDGTVTSANANTDLNNYNVTVVEGNYEIVEAGLIVEGLDSTSDDQLKEYDGTVLDFNEDKITVENAAGEAVEATKTYYKKDADGNYTIEVDVTDITATDVADSNEYKVVISAPGYTSNEVYLTMKITPKALEVTINDATKQYGVEDSYAGYITDGGLVAGEEIEVTINRIGIGANNGKLDVVNEYPNSLTGTVASGNASTDLNNYEVTVVKGDYEIVEAPLTVDGFDSTSDDQLKEYDGTVLDFNESKITVENAAGETVEATKTYYKKDADGNYTIEVDVTDITATDVADSDEYKVVISAPGYTSEEVYFTLEVTKKPLQVTINDITKQYGVEDSYAGYITDGGLVAGQEIEVTISRIGMGEDNGKYDVVGTYLASLNGTVTSGNASTDLNNYEVTVVNGDFEITKATLTVEGFDVSSSNQSKVYDGETLFFDENQITTSLDGVEMPTTSIKYYELNADGSFGKELTLEEIKATNVSDTKEYGIRIEADNFEAYETTFKMEVTRRPVSITVPSTSTQNGQSLTDSQLETLVDSALSNATTTSQGKAIINDADLGQIIASLTSGIIDVDGIHNDVLSLTFTVAGENTEITPKNGVANILINNNYEITVFYGDVDVESLPEVVIPPVVTDPTIDNDTNSTVSQENDTTQNTTDSQEEDENVGFEVEENENDDTTTPAVPEFGSGDGNDSWALLNLILLVISIVYSIYLLISKKKTKEEIIEDEKAQQITKRKGVTMIVNVAASIVALVLFLMTQDITKPMIILDIWTLAFVLIVVMQFIAVIISKKNIETNNE